MLVYMYAYVNVYPSRHLKGDDITSLNYEELIKIEQALEDGLTNVRERQVNTIVLSTDLFFIDVLKE